MFNACDGGMSDKQGMTLIEVLIALVIGIGVVSGLTAAYLTIQKNYSLFMERMNISQDSHAAAQLFTQLIQNAIKIYPYYDSDNKSGSDAITVEYTDFTETELGIYKKESYFIGKTKRYDKKQHAIFALYKRDEHGKKMEMIEGIDMMKILYSYIENDRMVDRSFFASQRPVGIAIRLNHIALHLVTKQNIYVALR